MGKQITDLPAKPVLLGTELLELQDGTGAGSSKQTTASAIAALNDADISAKADKTYVDTGLGLKADKTYVDTGLSGKANIVQNGDNGGALTEVAVVAYTLLLTDIVGGVRVTNALACTVTIPKDLLPLRRALPIFQGGAGAVTIVGASGVTLETPNGVATSAVGDFRVLYQRALNVWVLA